MNPRDRIILPLDVSDADSAARLVEQLGPYVGAFKVGLELVNSEGPAIFGRIRSAGAERIFYDCKLHDIPNTVAGAAKAAAKNGLWMINVHAAGGSRMIRAASDALSESGASAPILLGVTLLTSISQNELAEELRIPITPADYVATLAALVKDSGGQGVVASPHEIGAVRSACGPDFLIVTPGVRPAGADSGDQRRTMTPKEAVQRGADYLVIGRPITASASPVDSARKILDEIS